MGLGTQINTNTLLSDIGVILYWNIGSKVVRLVLYVAGTGVMGFRWG